ncbi:hypothetical protein [Effusibacillus dendaii]|uniref:Uncharacterized protein n=1 Tax=Effusibacillus dendaii TaxID=2743772 RepID=A0A7I8D8K6_9BACL|nr:hypothetical protein [Effusibacillus dendaii]BCJ85339.1 hypothetical protein skT53_03240 [Effusibacillus dendaii]
MKDAKSVPLRTVYSIFVEEPDDFYFHPRGVLMVDEKLNISLFCSDADHNFLLRVIRKFPYAELENGVEWNGYEFECKDQTATAFEKHGNSPDAIPFILKDIYDSSPRQYFFLEKALKNGPLSNHLSP